MAAITLNVFDDVFMWQAFSAHGTHQLQLNFQHQRVYAYML
jgi:hypothetical protein